MNLNEALGLLAGGEASDKRSAEALASSSALLDADAELAAGNTLMGTRLLNRGRVLLDYATQHPRLQQYRQYRVSEEARSRDDAPRRI